MAEPLEGQLANLLHHGVGSLPADQQDRLATFIAGLDLPDESVASKPLLTQGEATYTDSGPDPFLCATCSLFAAPDACALVEGDINPAGACRFWRGGAEETEADEPPGPVATVAVMNRTGA